MQLELTVAMRPQVIIQKRQIYKSRADMLNRSWVLFCDVRPATLFQPVAKKGCADNLQPQA